MKTHLSNALLHARIACDDLRAAHSYAIGDGNQFAEIVLLELLGDARKLEQRIARALDAAKANSADDEDRNKRALIALDQSFCGEAGK